MLKFIPKIISSEDNKELNKLITLDEVRSVVFNMNPEKSLGPDCVQAFFFQKFWDIVGEDLWRAIEASRNGGALLAEINYSFLTLIPKKNGPETPEIINLLLYATRFIKSSPRSWQIGLKVSCQN